MEQTDTKSVEELLTKCHAMLPPSVQELPTRIKRYPPLTVFTVIFSVISSLPLLVFVAFALSTFIFLLIGFLLVEGTLLAFGICILATALFFAAIAALGVTATVCVVGFVLSNWRQMVKECSEYVDSQLTKYVALDLSQKK